MECQTEIQLNCEHYINDVRAEAMIIIKIKKKREK